MARRRNKKSRPIELVGAVALIAIGLWITSRQPTSTKLLVLGIVLSIAVAIWLLIIAIIHKTPRKTSHDSPDVQAPTKKYPWPGPPEQDLYPLWKSASIDADQVAKVDASRWSRELLALLEWKRFEEVCAGLFERLGFNTKTATCGPDGGIDIHLYRAPSDQPVALVQCKAWNTRQVGVEVVRALLGVMTAERVSDGIFVTTSTYSGDAIKFAKKNNIDLMDGEAVFKAIHTLTQEQQDSLLKLATAGDYVTPTCPSCGIKMKKRMPRSGGKPFWGCVNYPRCNSMLGMTRM